MLKERKPIHYVLKYKLLNEKGEIEKIIDNGFLVMDYKVDGY